MTGSSGRARTGGGPGARASPTSGGPLAAELEEIGSYLVAEIEEWVGVMRCANIRID